MNSRDKGSSPPCESGSMFASRLKRWLSIKRSCRRPECHGTVDGGCVEGEQQRDARIMGTIWKRKDRDMWTVDFRDATGKRIRLTASTLSFDAETLLAEKIKETKDDHSTASALRRDHPDGVYSALARPGERGPGGKNLARVPADARSPCAPSPGQREGARPHRVACRPVPGSETESAVWARRGQTLFTHCPSADEGRSIQCPHGCCGAGWIAQIESCPCDHVAQKAKSGGDQSSRCESDDDQTT